MKTYNLQINEKCAGRAGEIVVVEIRRRSEGYFQARKLMAFADCVGGAQLGPPRIADHEQIWGRSDENGSHKWLSVADFGMDGYSGNAAGGFDLCGPDETFTVPVLFNKDCTVEIAVVGRMSTASVQT